jgi:hypothetical protein
MVPLNRVTLAALWHALHGCELCQRTVWWAAERWTEWDVVEGLTPP